MIYDIINPFDAKFKSVICDKFHVNFFYEKKTMLIKELFYISDTFIISFNYKNNSEVPDQSLLLESRC